MKKPSAAISAKQAIIIDTRFNGGGNIHEQLSDFLSGKKYIDIIPHGQYVGSEPYDKWTKPSIVLIGESNYSDAHLFPVAYKLKGVGKTLGMPVPGTGTFVWWESQIDPTLRFGIPMGGWRTPDGKFCENNQMEPDIKVRNEPDMMTARTGSTNRGCRRGVVEEIRNICGYAIANKLSAELLQIKIEFSRGESKSWQTN